MACACTDCEECQEAAEKKARRLLNSHLTDFQKRTLRRQGRITVTGNHTGDKYRIRNDAWVYRMRDGHGFCLDVFENDDDEFIPMPDRILTKKILIEADETLFLKTANQDDDDYRE